MLDKHKIIKAGKNKVLLYVSSRYLTYTLQFLNSIILAVALDASYALYGFILIVLQYIAQFNLGVPHSLNVLLSVNKGDKKKMDALLSTSLFIYLFLSLVIVLLFVAVSGLGIQVGEKFNFAQYAVVVIAIGIITHFNSLFSNYFRVINRLGEIIFFQSFIPVLTFVFLFFVKGELLLQYVLGVMLGGNILALLLFLKNAHVKIWKPDFSLMRPIIKKAFFLFLYNMSFYLILLSTRTVVSNDYSVSDFSLFTFSFTLANAIMLLFDSFSFLIYPKTIHRLSQADRPKVLHIIDLIRVNYITAIHFVLYCFILVFPVIIYFFPRFDSVFKCFTLIAMTVILYSNCFAYSSFLTAKGQERRLCVLAFLTLALNVGLCFFISRFLKAGYSYVILATFVSYIFYNLLLAFQTYRVQLKMDISFWGILKENYPARLFLPFAIGLAFAFLNLHPLSFLLVLALYILLNRKQLVMIKQMVGKIIQDANIINI